MRDRTILILIAAAITVLADNPKAFAVAGWIEAGPATIVHGDDEGLCVPLSDFPCPPPNNPVSGAINAIAADPSNPDVLYVGAVNGGVWGTIHATSPDPDWHPLTDLQLPALSINSLAVSPVDSNTLFAGSGSTSSLGEFWGSPGFGVARSTDGGVTWTVLAAETFAGKMINSIVPTRLSDGHVVLAATLDDGGGVYRSINNGASFEDRISGKPMSGLPDAGVSKLIADPSNPKRFYAGVPFYARFPGHMNGGSQTGVYRSDDGGMTWVNAGLDNAVLLNSTRILLTVHNDDAGNNVVYAMIIATDGMNSGKLGGVFRSSDQGGSWTNLGIPVEEIFYLGQGNIQGAVAADPSNPNVVFISGDTLTDCGASVFRYSGTAWERVVCDGAQNTSPHSDSRDMAFDANRDLLETNDGGIFRLVSPNNAGTRRWVSVNGDIRVTEFQSVAYDPLGRVALGGTQDNGTVVQTVPSPFGAVVWNHILGGDGEVVAVDADQVAHPGKTYRYSSSPSLSGFNRTTWDAANNMIIDDTNKMFNGFAPVALKIVSGPGAGQTLYEFDKTIQGHNPYVLNVIDPKRMLIGTQRIYESMDKGDSLTNLGDTGRNIGVGFGQPLTYGGCLNGCQNGTRNPDVFYVASGDWIYHRTTLGGATMRLTAYPGSTVVTVVMNPQNYRQVFVSDDQNRVWGSFDEGAHWAELTADLPQSPGQKTTIEVFSPDATIRNTVLIASGFGVFEMRRPAAAGSSWTPILTFPNVLVLDLHYDYTNNVLVAGTLGRGAWTLTGFFRGGGQP
jgi:hypothetical protein